tara:strand:+ start:878 stop:1597 length:720 start_codon:yes stop_codon:yes gene_type:complete
MYTTFRNLYLFLLKKIRNYTIGIIRDFNFFRETPFEKYQKESLEKSYNHFKKYFAKSIFLRDDKIKNYAILKSLEIDKEGLYLEFGVHKGRSINLLSKLIKDKTIYGFDSFEGLREDWKGTQATKGTFDLKGQIPKLNKNVSPIKGWIQDTLPNFIKKSENINFVHIDVDTYSTSNFILKTIKPFLNDGAIILFDEMYNCIGWEENEYKSLIENFNEAEYNYLAFSKEDSQVLIEYKKK